MLSGHHSHYRDNYKSQVYHVGCQVIAWQEGDIRQVASHVITGSNCQVVTCQVSGDNTSIVRWYRQVLDACMQMTGIK